MSASDQILGLGASVLSLVLWWPQAVRVWRSRADMSELSGVSVATQVMLVANAALWGAYAIATESFWVGAPGLINAPLAMVTIAILRRSARARTEARATPGREPRDNRDRNAPVI